MVTLYNGKKYPFEECAAYFYFLIKRNHYQAYLINEIYTNIYTILYNTYDVGQLFVNICEFLSFIQLHAHIWIHVELKLTC